MMIVLGIDPGLMTGISLVEYERDIKLEKVETYEWSVEEFYLGIDRLVGLADVVVMEDFYVTLSTVKKTFYPQSLHLIGLVGYLCYHQKKKLVLQGPADREFSPQHLMKELGLWHVSGAGHSIQSIRHVFRYLAMQDRSLAKLVLDTM